MHASGRSHARGVMSRPARARAASGRRRRGPPLDPRAEMAAAGAGQPLHGTPRHASHPSFKTPSTPRRPVFAPPWPGPVGVSARLHHGPPAPAPGRDGGVGVALGPPRCVAAPAPARPGSTRIAQRANGPGAGSRGSARVRPALLGPHRGCESVCGGRRGLDASRGASCCVARYSAMRPLPSVCRAGHEQTRFLAQAQHSSTIAFLYQSDTAA
jgi:hypothetical protein